MANGVTGNVSFDEFGRRQNYTLTLIGISPTGFNEVIISVTIRWFQICVSCIFLKEVGVFKHIERVYFI